MCDALAQYIAVRRALGAKLPEPPRTLGRFIEFLKEQGTEFITTELALRWAMRPQGVQRGTWARRLSMVRRFAIWLHAIDPRTQVPPARLLSVSTILASAAWWSTSFCMGVGKEELPFWRLKAPVADCCRKATRTLQMSRTAAEPPRIHHRYSCSGSGASIGDR